MSQLCAQSIYELCVPFENNRELYDRRFQWHHHEGVPIPMISPFLSDKIVINGKSAGLSSASYDIRIAHDLVLARNPAISFLRWMKQKRSVAEVINEVVSGEIALMDGPSFALAHSIENFAIPNGVAAYVCDKSSWARLGVSAFNTLFDPGFRGNATLELVNHSDREVVIKAGDPICQMVFQWLDRETDRPYKGKYQDQPEKVVGAIHENIGLTEGLR